MLAERAQHAPRTLGAIILHPVDFMHPCDARLGAAIDDLGGGRCRIANPDALWPQLADFIPAFLIEPGRAA
jgi:hypothetical protein